MIEVKSKNGLDIICEIKNFSYNGTFMGVRSITCTYKSPEIIPFAIGDYVEYRGEKFVLDYDPSDAKEAEVRRLGDAITYNLTFHPESAVELENCDFCDYVLYDNQLHYSSSPKFSFIGTANDLADRIKANLDRLYPGKWTIEIDSSVVTEDKNIEIENTSCWNAVVLFNKEFGLNFTIINRKIKVGFSSNIVKHTFNYGSGNGLYKIERNVNSDEAVITRLKAYGGDRNLPEGYNKLTTDIVPKKNLMLPGYKETGIDYIESANTSVYGIRPYAIVFDDIYPSIEGVEVDGIGRIDEIVSADQITTETEANSTFKVRIKDIGFDINDYLVGGETATISMESGSLIGYEFEITRVEKLDAGGYELTLNKSQRDNWTVPNKDQNLSAGDRFVLLNIRMPEKYVAYGEERLLEHAKGYLARYDHVTYTYDIGVDEIFMARNVSLYESIREGDKLPIYDEDLLIDYDIIIQSLVITEGGNVPIYKISLSDQPVAGTIDKIWDAINNIKNQGIVSTPIISGGGISQEELNRKYLRKDIDQIMHGELLFDKKIGSSIFVDDWEGKGWEITAPGAATFDSIRVRSDMYIGGRMGSPSFASGFPEGWGWDLAPYTIINSAGVEETRYRLEIDDIVARGNARFYEMIISQLRGEDDNVVFSGQMKVAYYDASTGRLYLDTEGGILYNPFRPGDLLEVARFNGMPSADNNYYITKQYELQVEEVGVGSFSDGEDRLDWITFKNFVGDLSLIAKGDVLTRQDSATDVTRKGIVKITTIDELGTPHISALYGMKTNPEDSLLARLGNCAGIRTKSGVQLSEMVGLYARGAFFENSTIILENGDTIEQTFSAMNGKFESLIDGIRNDMSTEGGNILVNSSFSQNTNYWTSANTVHFINVAGEYLWVDGSFYVEKDAVADIFNDGGQNVLRIRNTYILQQNSIMHLPEHTETPEDGYTYSFALFYKVIRPGTLSVGVPGTGLYTEEQLTISDSYKKLSKVAKWNEKGDFKIQFTGEILIYGVSLFNDETADALIHMQTQILQTLDAIKLLASKDYVDAETGKIYTKYNAELSVMAQEISARVTQQQLNTATGAVERELSGLISIQAGNIETVARNVNTLSGTVTDVGQRVDAINRNLELYVKDSDLNGNEIVGRINLTSTTATIGAKNINLQGYTTINGAFKIDEDGFMRAENGGVVGDFHISDGKTSGVNKNQLISGNYGSGGNGNYLRLSGNTIDSHTYSAGITDSRFGFTSYPLDAANTIPSYGGYISVVHNQIYIGSSSFDNDSIECVGFDVYCDGKRDKDPYGRHNIYTAIRARMGSLRVEDGNLVVNEHIDDVADFATEVIVNSIKHRRTYIFQPTSDTSVALPARSEMSSFLSPNDHMKTFTINILITRWATARITLHASNILSAGASTPLLNANAEMISENASSYYKYGNIILTKGDSCTLRYYNGAWYITQLYR